jgi:hypothetical protein
MATSCGSIVYNFKDPTVFRWSQSHEFTGSSSWDHTVNASPNQAINLGMHCRLIKRAAISGKRCGDCCEDSSDFGGH